MTWRNRILDDGLERDKWLASRYDVIGASDAAKLAKPESVDKYLAAKLGDHGFTGNAFTESGNRWEPMMLAWLGITPNVALIHAPDERGFASTPDGILTTLSGTRGAECKAKHLKVVTGPTLGEWRQLSWQLHTVPELEEIEFTWVELDAEGELRQCLNGEPKSLTVKRNDPKVIGLLEKMLPIATDLLARLQAARRFEKELAL